MLKKPAQFHTHLSSAQSLPQSKDAKRVFHPTPLKKTLFFPPLLKEKIIPHADPKAYINITQDII